MGSILLTSSPRIARDCGSSRASKFWAPGICFDECSAKRLLMQSRVAIRFCSSEARHIMSAFQVELKHLERKPVERDFQPDAETLNELFDDLSGDFRITGPEGFHAHISAQMSDSTVHVGGQASAEFAYRCGRCLGEQHLAVDTAVDFVLMSEAEWSSSYAGKEEIELHEDDLDVNFYTGDSVDLGELIREAIILELPAFPHCPVEDKAECDARYEERVGEKALDRLDENSKDVRWSALRELEVTEDGELKKKDREKKSD